MYSGNYRNPFIDYKAPGFYMITMSKREEIPFFSKLLVNKNFIEPAKLVSAKYNPLGHVIRKSFDDFKGKYPKIGIAQHVIMPDHIHFILQIKERLEEHLGRYIGRLRFMIKDRAISEGWVPVETPSLFKKGYNDQFLNEKRSLKVLINYVRENPYRLWVKKTNPSFFSLKEIVINGEVCRIYGNEELLKHPFIVTAIAHTSYSEEELNQRIEYWKYILYNGGVLMGNFVHPVEKELYHEALNNGGKIIKLDEIPQDKRWKPSGRSFELCKQGKLLLLHPMGIEALKYGGLPNKNKMNRQQFRYMNEFAEKYEKERNLGRLL